MPRRRHTPILHLAVAMVTAPALLCAAEDDAVSPTPRETAPVAAKPSAGHSAKAVEEALRPRVDAFVDALGSEHYRSRKAAQEMLEELPAACLPLLRAHAAQTDDLEVRLRLKRVIRKLAMTGETNPNLLAVHAREEALAGRYFFAQHFYGMAAREYTLKALNTRDRIAREQLHALANKARERRQRAANLDAGKNDSSETIIRIQLVNGQPVRLDDNGKAEAPLDW